MNHSTFFEYKIIDHNKLEQQLKKYGLSPDEASLRLGRNKNYLRMLIRKKKPFFVYEVPFHIEPRLGFPVDSVLKTVTQAEFDKASFFYGAFGVREEPYRVEVTVSYTDKRVPVAGVTDLSLNDSRPNLLAGKSNCFTSKKVDLENKTGNIASAPDKTEQVSTSTNSDDGYVIRDRIALLKRYCLKKLYIDLVAVLDTPSTTDEQRFKRIDLMLKVIDLV